MAGGWSGLIRRLGRSRWLAVPGRVVVPVDTAVQRASRGRLSLIGMAGLPHLLLTTAGARTGRPRQVPLLYARDGDRYVVAGSNWGKPGHPAWSANLLAHPDATVNLRGTDVPVRARLASGADRARLWALLTVQWPGYDGYASRTGREIRVFVLEPRQPA